MVRRPPGDPFFSFFLKILSGFASDLAKISGDPPETPRGGSPGGLRTISAGTTLLGHTVDWLEYLLPLFVAPNEAWEWISDNADTILIVEIGPSSVINTSG